jgi:1-acyl-sn-glycerol-3-phosphate acyltransferase
MISFSYNFLRTLGRIAPVCPKPEAVGLENIPKNGPIIYVYNHITRRGEPVYLGVAAPKTPNIRFLAEITIADKKYFSILRKDVENSIFPPRFQKKIRRRRWAEPFYDKLIDYLTRYLIAQINRINAIIVNLWQPETEEERLKIQRTTKQALKECVKSLENDIPIAIAPSGGKTYENIENPVYHTIIPMLASMFFKRGKVVKIVPSVVKERPMIDKRTYWRYVADRIFIYRAVRWTLNLLKIKSYKKSCLTVEFLPPLTFENAGPSKPEKIEFVKNLQELIYSELRKE